MIALDYSGKVVLVTGGGRGIGLAITKAFAEAGATVIVTYTSRDPSEIIAAVGKEYGVKVVAYHCPGEQSEIVNTVIEKASKEVGEIDVVVANAGVSLWRDAISTSDAELRTLMDTNLFAPIYLARACVRHWLGLGTALDSEDKDKEVMKAYEGRRLGKKILFVSSISGIVAMTPQPQMAYNASKAGLTMAAKSLAGEWARFGITVNAISPGYVKTDMIANPPPGEEAWVAKWKDMTPLGEFADAKQVGDLVVMLCHERNKFMTGSDVVADGGYTIF